MIELFKKKNKDKEKNKQQAVDDVLLLQQQFIDQSRELDKLLFRGLNNKIKMVIDDSLHNTYSYILSNYKISVPDRTIELDLKLEGNNLLYKFYLCKKYADFEIKSILHDDEDLVETKFHIALDGKVTKITVVWNNWKEYLYTDNRIIFSKDLPYENSSGLKRKVEEYKRNNSYNINNIISELYTKDNKDRDICILHIKGNIRFIDNITGKCGLLEYHREGNTIMIDDNIQYEENAGRGSMAINTLIDYAKSINIKFIKGELVETDERTLEKKEWRDSYYKSKGFIINDRIIKLEL